MIWYNDFKIVDGKKRYTIIDSNGNEIAEFSTMQIPLNVVATHNEIIGEAIKYGSVK